MRLFVVILCILFALAPVLDLGAQEESPTPEEKEAVTTPETAEESQEKPTVREEKEPETAPEVQQPVETAQPPEEETGLDDEGLFEDALPADTKKPAGGQVATIGPRKLTIDAVVVVNYKFASSSETYNVKYHINMGGEINADVSLIKGNAKVATDISGFLAKSSAFECILKVSIADVPYEIMFKKMSEKEADINVAFKGQILEDWESLCTFMDTSGAKFNTRGSPEKWIGIALEKSKPSLSSMTAPIDGAKTTTLKFLIPKYTVEDEGLGKADIDGTGVVTIQPEVSAPKKE